MKKAFLLLLATFWSGLFITVNPGFADIWIKARIPAEQWTGVTSSANGAKLVATAYDGGIYTSRDSGFTWVKTKAPQNAWQSVASSADGTRLVAGAGDYSAGGIFISKDSGRTWWQTGIFPTDSVASSADGTKMTAATVQEYTVITSRNSGGTWIVDDVPPSPWRSIASSSDGRRLVAASLLD